MHALAFPDVSLAFPDVSARLIVQPGASGAVVLLTTRVVRRPLSAPTVDDDAALAQRLQCEEEECAAAESAQTESDAVLARELAGVLPSAERAQTESDAVLASELAGVLPSAERAQTESDAELARELAGVLPFAAAPPPSHSAFGAVVLEGLLEKKPVRGLGMMERGLFPNGGFRARRVVLREVSPQPLPPAMVADGAAPSRRSCQLEWHHTDEDEAAPSSLRLELASARVRRGGDVGDDEPERLLTVELGLGSGLGLGRSEASSPNMHSRCAASTVEA